MNRWMSATMAGGLGMLLLGCDAPPAPPAPVNEPKSEAKAAEPAPPPPDFSAALLEAAAKGSETAKTNPNEQPPAEEPEMVTEVAATGLGTKGHGYGGGMITEPVRAYFRIQESVVLDIELPQAMRTFKALDPNGKGPKSHEQFMTEVVEAYSIRLPELPIGHQYLYDPETETLLVQRPKE